MFNVQHSTMSPVLPFDIIALIIDNVGENKDTDLKELVLVSHSFLQNCSKHLFATIELDVSSLKKGFVKLLKSRSDVVRYIPKLTYIVSYNFRLSQLSPTHPSSNDGFLVSPILSNFFLTISHLNCLKINALQSDWNTLDSSLTSAFLHLMHLPSINHIDLLFIQNFLLSSRCEFQLIWRGWCSRSCCPVGDVAQNSWILCFRVLPADDEVITC